MENTKNPYLRTHIAIIKALLDGSKKTQNQIAKETNYEKSTISHALDYLEKKKKVIIRETIKKESGYTNKGNYNNKLCWLTFKVDNGKHVLEFLREILKEDISLIPDLQKSDIILSTLVDNDLLDSYVGILRDLLRLSPSFFEGYLIQDLFFDEFTEIMMKLQLIDEHGFYSEENNRYGRAYLKYGVDVTAFQEEHYHFILFEMFRHSLIEDYFKGGLNPEAVSYYQNNKGKFSLEQLQAWHNGMDSIQERKNKPVPEICINNDSDKFEYSDEEIEKEFKEKEKEYDMELMSNPYL
jgi:hypothetical protein